ncbi:Protein of unknown function [Pseudomonas cedrina]|uniref:DUF1120 domain-containing protein n=2 Tax=Pseudomonas cedrina TaxID=651740 RepID=A0A1V2KCH7_PSECE|nr:DUF1120 domain-containing protein [Pseudomonas cedrina]ONH55214.1 hypothetical protein BLL36_09955 [Pseudomonas cedrina subsp. cedrina]SDR90066.1 Protein of unknown function [Pseudomonas cedrina]
MKNSIFTAALLLASVSNVLAASSIDLSVTGAITPAACTPALSGGGVVDHGKISFSDLNKAWPYQTQLPVATLALSVNCSAATLFAVKSHDNRAGTVSAGFDVSSFGLGLVNGDKKVGWYTLKMSNSLADGVPQSVIESVDGKTWFDAPEDLQVWQPDWMRAFSAVIGSNAAPIPVQAMTTDLLIQTTIVDKRELPTGQEVPLDGSATLDIVYL